MLNRNLVYVLNFHVHVMKTISKLCIKLSKTTLESYVQDNRITKP